MGGDADGLGALGSCGWARARFFVLDGGAYESSEERVRLKRLGFEFGMELAA